MHTEPDRLVVSLVVNGRPRSAEVPTRTLLSDFLRHELGLTGTHVGCEHGVCGACTVQLDGQPVRSCLTFAASADGLTVRTVEALATDTGAATVLSPLQAAFKACHGLQCGYCTPGILMTMDAFLDGHPDPAAATESEIREALSGNLCRCTGYQHIVDAVKQAAAQWRTDRAAPAGAGGAPGVGAVR